jgi:hypothetical protein
VAALSILDLVRVTEDTDARGALGVAHTTRLGKKPSALALLPLGAAGELVAVVGDKAGDCVALPLPAVGANMRTAGAKRSLLSVT